MDITELIKASKTGFKRHPWELTRLKMLRFFIGKCPLSKSSAILDAGSGDAFLAKSIAERYKQANVYAADINYSSEILEIITKNKPANLFFFDEIEKVPTDRPIDLVVMMDILEHLESPGEILQSITNLKSTNPETRFIITVPAFQRLFSEHDTILGHYRRYNLREIKSLLLSANMKILHIGYAFGSLLPVRWVQLFLEKKRTTEKAEKTTGVTEWKGGRLLTGLIIICLWLEFKISWYLALAGIKLPGLSCYCICQPSPS